MEDRLEANDSCLGFIGVKCFVRRKVQVDPSRLTLRQKKLFSSVVVCGVSQPSMVLTFIGGVEIGDRSDGSGHWGLSSSSCRITAIVANTLKGLGGKLRSFRLGGTIGFGDRTRMEMWSR